MRSELESHSSRASRRRQRRVWWFRGATVLSAVVLTAVLAECLLWLFAPLASHELLHWIPDGHVRGRAMPNQTLQTGDGFEIRINRFGFRGPDYATRPDEGMLRLATFGGSSTFGLDAKGLESTWPGRLQTLLTNKLGMPVEVVNLGLPGFDSCTSKLNYLITGRALHPHVVLIYHTWNDLKRFRVIAAGTELSVSPLRGKRWWARLARETQLARRAARVVNRFRAREIENTYVFLDTTEASEASPVSAMSLAWARQNFRDFALFAHSDGVLPVLVSQATLAHSTNVERKEFRLSIRNDFVKMTLQVLCTAWREMTRIIEETASETDAVFVDGYRAIPPDIKHLRDHVHLTDLGRAKLAYAVAETLLNDARFIAVVERIRGGSGSAPSDAP